MAERKKQKVHGSEVARCPASEEFYVRVYRGHKGKFGHEFDELLFTEGTCKHVNNVGKGKAAFTNAVKLSKGVQATIQKSSEDSGVIAYDSQDWPHKVAPKGEKLALEIKLGSRHVVLEMADPQSMTTDGLPVDQASFLELIVGLRKLAYELETENKRDPFAGALPTAKTIIWAPTAGLLARLNRAFEGPAPTTSAADAVSEASAVDSYAVSHAATDTYTVHSTFHSRERMEQRSITKRDLQRAIKYAGHLAVPGKPSRLSGEPTFLIEYEGIVYCTDHTKKWAITAWRANDDDEKGLLPEPMRVEEADD
eukprot:3446753-Prymnesium_polylepis.1